MFQYILALYDVTCLSLQCFLQGCAVDIALEPWDMAIAESVLSMASIASLANASLRASKSEEQLRDLAHGPVELLRENLLQVVVQDGHEQLAQTVRAITDMLLLLKGLLLAWDCSMCPEAILELPLPKFPKHYPNRCWHWKHPRSRFLSSEVRSSAQFLCENSHVFTTEPWVWIQGWLLGIEETLFEEVD